MIPKVMHFVWIDPADTSDDRPALKPEVEQAIDQWRQTHPEFERRVWSLKDIDQELSNVLDADIGALVRSCSFAAMQADIARLAIIHRFGGVWNDLKNVARRPFLDPLVEQYELLLCERFPTPPHPDPKGTLSNSWFAAAPGNAFIERCLRRVINSVSAREPGSIFTITGGGVLDRVAANGQCADELARARVLTWQEAWRDCMGRKAMAYNKGKLHWSIRQKVEPLYLDSSGAKPGTGGPGAKRAHGAKRPVLHLGFHKTATTLVQSMLQSSDAAGRCLALTPRSEAMQRVRLEMMRSRDSENYPLAKVTTALAALLGNLATTELPVCISDENLLGFPPYRHPEPDCGIRLYPSLERQFEVLAELARNHDFEMVLVIRQQSRLIQSLYLDGLKYFRYGLTADEYVQSLDLSSFCWRDRLSTMPEALRERTRLLALERLNTHPQEFLGMFCPVDADDAMRLQQRVVNPARQAEKLAIARLVGASQEPEKSVLLDWFRAMPEWPASDITFPELALSAPLAAEIDRYFVGDLASLWPADRAALDLDEALALRP